MLDVEIIRGPKQPIGKYIQSALSDAVVCKIASAYVTSRALNSLERHFERILDGNGSISVIHGADGQITSPDVLKRLANLNFQYDCMKYRVHSPIVQSHERLFHPKIYFAGNAHENYVSIVGSSNATSKGLTENIEANVVIRGKRHDPAIAQCSNSLDALMKDHDVVEPTAEWICIYEQIYLLRQSWRKQESDNQELGDLYSRLSRLSPQVEHWIAQTQEECVLKAVQELESELGHDQGVHWDTIKIRAIHVAQRDGHGSKWRNWESSVRRCLNTNTVGKPRHKWYERVGGEDSKSGFYRLSERGRRYMRHR